MAALGVLGVSEHHRCVTLATASMVKQPDAEWAGDHAYVNVVIERIDLACVSHPDGRVLPQLLDVDRLLPMRNPTGI